MAWAESFFTRSWSFGYETVSPATTPGRTAVTLQPSVLGIETAVAFASATVVPNDSVAGCFKDSATFSGSSSSLSGCSISKSFAVVAGSSGVTDKIGPGCFGGGEGVTKGVGADFEEFGVDLAGSA